VSDLFGFARAEPPAYFRASYSGEAEWYTPAEVIEAARAVLGSIDLDPASCEQANRTVQAARYFTKRENGLVQSWHGRIWLNPPYSQPTLGRFVAKLLQEVALGRVSAAILLVNNCTDTAWFHDAALACAAMCFTRGRVRFETPGGLRGSPVQGQAFFYFGDAPATFARHFSTLGSVMRTSAQGAQPLPLFRLNGAAADD
jgi:phage N-6-adenine-methyltransferase